MLARLGAVLCVVVCVLGLAGCERGYNGVAKDSQTATALARKYCESFHAFHTPPLAHLQGDKWIITVREAGAWAEAIIDARTGKPLECRAVPNGWM